jgi:spore coat polysaccharide biosynthesis protein SpsF (cytidylyltransferase family)
MPKVVAIIQARMGSTRLPGKVLMDLKGKPVLQWVVEAAQNARLVDEVIVVTPDLVIADWCGRHGVQSLIGPEDDVLARFVMAAEKTKADVIVRLTADCPFLDPILIDLCIATRSCAVDEWPDGKDVQVFETAWLAFGDKEHVVPVKNNLPQLSCPAGNMRHIRLTLDTADDLQRLRAL